jgi:TnpA family transposase
MRQEPLPLDIDTHLPSYMAEYRHKLEDNLTNVACKARENTLPDVTLTDGDLRITPLRKNTPESAEVFAENAYALMPHVKITELTARGGRSVDESGRSILASAYPGTAQKSAGLVTAVLADGINLGLTRMSEACRETTWRQLSWTADWHVREECYAQALAGLIDAQHRLPLAAHWGSGATSSSDAQFFRAGGRGEVGGLVNLHYGQDPGVKFYTHLSDQFGPFHTRVIAATANEAPHVLDGLLYHKSSLVINEHYTDTGGFSDNVFAMCHLLGFRFAPRIRDLKEKRLYILPGMTVPPELASLVAGAINLRALSDHWIELLRLAMSIKTGTVTASVILRKLSAYPRQNGLALALRELGKLGRTLFTLEWLQDPELRRRNHGRAQQGRAAKCASPCGVLQPAW